MNIEFRRLAVHHLHGRSFNGLSAEGLHPGLNLILAANGTGKSVLTAAAGRAMDCRSLQSGDCLSGQFQIDATLRDFHLFGPSSQPVDWPQALRPDLYTWTLPEFLTQIASGDCQQLAAALAGGLNLDAFKRDSGPRRPPAALAEAWDQLRQRRERAGETAEQELRLPQRQQELRQSRQAREALQCLQRWQQHRRDQQELQQAEAALARLQQRWPGLEREESGTWERVSDALATLEGDRQELQQARAALQRFHDRPAPRLLQHEDEEILNGLESAWQLHRAAWQDRQHAIREADRRRQELADHFRHAFSVPPPEPLPDNIGALAACRLWRNFDVCIRQLQDEHVRQQRDYDEAESKRCQAAAALPDIAVPAGACRDMLLQHRRLPRLMDAIREKKVRQAALSAELSQRQVERQKLAGTEQAGRACAGLLGQWLALLQPAPSSSLPRLLPLCAWGLLVWLTLTAALLLIPAASTFLPAALSILGGLAALLAAMVMIRAGQTTDARRRRQQLQTQLQTQLPGAWQPATWTPDDVRASLEAALAAVAAGQSRSEAVARLQAMLEGLDTIPEAAELDQLRRELAKRTGLRLHDQDGYDLADFCANLERLAEAELRCSDVGGRLAQCEGRLQHIRRELQESLSGHGIPDGISSGEMAEAWITQVAALLAADSARTIAVAEAEALQAELQRHQEKLALLYRRYEFDPGDDCFAQLPTFRQWLLATAHLRQADDRCRSHERHLVALLDAGGIPAGGPDASPFSLSERLAELQTRREPQQEWQSLRRGWQRLQEKLTLADTADFSRLAPYVALDSNPSDMVLEELRQTLLQQSAREDSLREEISRLEAEIAQATRGDTVTELDRKLHESIQQTGQWLQNRTDAAAARSVCNFMQEKIREEATPAIVRSANLTLARLTAGRCRDIQVESDADRPTLSLFDQFDSRRKTFGELSAGTRVHLGMAVRLACIEAAEAHGGGCFPLLLDEVLAVSDSDTARLIAAALLDLAQQRQVILLTCQDEDIFLLQELVGRPLTVIRLHAPPMLFTPPPPQPRLNPSMQEISCPDGALPLRTAVRLWPLSLLEPLLPELPADGGTATAALAGLPEAARQRVESILAAAETARQLLAPSLLTPEDIPDGCSWCTDAFRQKVLEALLTAGGNPFRFLEQLSRISKFGRRLDTCREWLEADNRLNPPPTQLQLWQAAYDALPGTTADRPLIARKISEFFLPGSDMEYAGASAWRPEK